MTCGDLLVATRTCQDTVATREASFAKQLLIIIIIVYVEGCTSRGYHQEGVTQITRIGTTRLDMRAHGEKEGLERAGRREKFGKRYGLVNGMSML